MEGVGILVVSPAIYSLRIPCARIRSSRSVPMKAELTVLDITASPGLGLA